FLRISVYPNETRSDKFPIVHGSERLFGRCFHIHDPMGGALHIGYLPADKGTDVAIYQGMMNIRSHTILYRGGPFVASRSTLRDPIGSSKLHYTFPILLWIQASTRLNTICITMRGKHIKIGSHFFLHKRIDVGTMPGCWVVGFIGGHRHIF